ncbi:MAG: hypothetical protein ACRBB0_17875 [Pelagimonas sp.]|uniref:hypothetical protein n=1 Tax=Pelagimonas sp. TaxID=2073170 RepID=UPI003D6AF4B9
MPIAIVMSQSGAIPAIIAEDTTADLVAALTALADAPDLANEGAARLWLQSLPQPSGWFKTAEEARAHVQRMKEDVPILPGAEIAAAREALGLGRAQFASALGMGGNDNTRHKAIFDIENEAINKSSGRPRVLNPNATLRLRALMAENGLGK